MIIQLRNWWRYHLSIDHVRQVFLFSLINVFMLTSAIAQTQSVAGIITDESDNPLPGVLIQLTAEPSKGTISDINGYYSIDVAPTDILKFSFIGYISREITVGSQTKIDIKSG